MILADTSVWIDHLRAADARLVSLLERRLVAMHPFIRGEIALGSLARRGEVLALMGDLPRAVRASDEEALTFIEAHTLAGSGIGYVDAHLLVSAALTQGGRLWTRDKRLSRVAAGLDLAFRPPPA